ncbi:TetR/AcrR family transcriptional regulator [Shewanella sp. SR43-4]|jgi:TetR/AcrR family transcriptional repressor of nem operon|uniref:TetR/AcrR family transcriptional regulator n=1 Tax=Shewanella TaxID=22 RepID=UPI000C4461D8|nr:MULTISPECIES: TetR/AcrR family transcriptional regulator [Shewanella]NCQ45723.1 TetR/AcrR family transcriptional regulator [Shewanella frigidimarina]MBB1318482.1 TetR/AcrR family transcriptional regulator [Shewanella sp. SR43-4]MBB1322460.1 TetR/AcrR family transcriptional regulator [Shewanella sp. SR43-8]NCO72394.1 TetR/AcrR family transcriptional regulator [Shewanella vesiculosa]NCP36088.1 TetR/AcrR family transcriptional regulator [Shewanella vesiculosa]|tara:strand:- start:774 stop:1358 length:585 start_codon:yes stop_codon:yes gene_type:complete
MNKSAASRQSICAVGEKLFALHGYSGVGIKLILDEVGIPKGSFYHYFASKEAFAAAVAEHYFQLRIQPIAIDSSVNFKTNLSTMLNGYHQLIDELFSGSEPRGCLMGNLMVEVSSKAPLLHQTLNHLYDQWLGLLSALIEQGQLQGHIRTDLPALTLASVFWANWQGTMLRCQIKVDKMAAKRALVQCMQMMTR